MAEYSGYGAEYQFLPAFAGSTERKTESGMMMTPLILAGVFFISFSCHIVAFVLKSYIEIHMYMQHEQNIGGA